MTESHGSAGQHGPSIKTYLMIFGALCAFTLVSFVVNWCVRHMGLSPYAGFIIILSVAVCKAALVGAYFMHLMFDWGRVYLLIIPTLVLGPMMLLVLLPDIVLAWQGVAPIRLP